MYKYILILMVVSLTSCTQDPAHEAYKQWVGRGYYVMAEAAKNQKLDKASDYLAQKGISTMNYGYLFITPPDHYGTNQDPYINLIYKNLIQLSQNIPPHEDSYSMAAASILYDCWLIENTYNNKLIDQISCKDGMLQAMQELNPYCSPLKGVESEYSVFFDFNKSNIAYEQYKVISHIVDLSNQFPNAFINITGYADEVGTEKYNKKLSMERAKHVERAIIKKGVNKKRIIIKAVGALDPFVNTRLPELLNRRAVINISNCNK